MKKNYNDRVKNIFFKRFLCEHNIFWGQILNNWNWKNTVFKNIYCYILSILEIWVIHIFITLRDLLFIRKFDLEVLTVKDSWMRILKAKPQTYFNIELSSFRQLRYHQHRKREGRINRLKNKNSKMSEWIKSKYIFNDQMYFLSFFLSKRTIFLFFSNKN